MRGPSACSLVKTVYINAENLVIERDALFYSIAHSVVKMAQILTACDLMWNQATVVSYEAAVTGGIA